MATHHIKYNSQSGQHSKPPGLILLDVGRAHAVLQKIPAPRSISHGRAVSNFDRYTQLISSASLLLLCDQVVSVHGGGDRVEIVRKRYEGVALVVQFVLHRVEILGQLPSAMCRSVKSPSLVAACPYLIASASTAARAAPAPLPFTRTSDDMIYFCEELNSIGPLDVIRLNNGHEFRTARVYTHTH